MGYQSLLKLFFYDTEEYKAEYQKRFEGSHTVHLDFLINENQAFFVLEPSLYNQIIDIYKTMIDFGTISYYTDAWSDKFYT